MMQIQEQMFLLRLFVDAATDSLRLEKTPSLMLQHYQSTLQLIHCCAEHSNIIRLAFKYSTCRRAKALLMYSIAPAAGSVRYY